MKLIANKEMYYDRRMVKAEEEFDCDEKFVDVLVLTHAARKPLSAKSSTAPIAEPADEQISRKTRGYKRRDMVAESP